jgi:phage terminase small subunit
MRAMTKPMANPSQRAQRLRSTEPVPARKIRGNNNGRGLDAARARGADTSNLSVEEMAEVISPDKPLTEKQRLFVQYWAQGDSIPGASRRAGYNDGASIAYRMVKMPNVLALKAKYEAEWQETGQMTRQRVMDGMMESIEMAKLMAEPASMIAGWREIGKICGFYAPVEHKVKVDVTGNIVLDRLNSLSDAELLKIISKGSGNALTALPDSI